MDYIFKKAENCFADAENYEYKLEVIGADFIKLLDSSECKVTINTKLRRPTFTCLLDNGIQFKGLLERKIIKVGFVPNNAQKQKTDFDKWLKSI